METSKPTVAELFGQKRRFVVPIYQRHYVWNAEKHWSYLWDDIKRKTMEYRGPEANQSMSPHFMGALVLLPQPAVRNTLPFKEVIDGQQRIITIQILLSALRDVAIALNIQSVDKDLLDLTRNDGLMENTQLERWKVWPTNSDQEQFVKVMESRSREEVERIFPSRREGRRTIAPDGLPGAYLYFYDEMMAFLTKDDNERDLPSDETKSLLIALLWALQNLFQFVCIDLDSRDDPQVIFEALNGRGEPLLPSDLIKNYVFQRAQQKGGDIPRLYQDYWQEFDTREVKTEEQGDAPPQRFWRVMEKQGRLERPRIDLFLFHFIQCKEQKEILITELFKGFKDWWTKTPTNSIIDVQTRVKDLRAEGDLFVNFFQPDRNTVNGTHLQNLKAMDTSTIYPLLLYIFGEARRSNRLSDTELPGILQTLESFLVRRFVCNMITKQYNRLFMQVLKNIHNSDGTITANSLQQELLGLQGSTVEWPTDEQFRRSWMVLPIYSSGRAAPIKMILSTIDRAQFGQATESVRISYDRLWIEHVMPQGWREYWQHPDGQSSSQDADINVEMMTAAERRDEMLHTFGNLTLLTDKLNRSISNAAYVEKRPAIRLQSALKLNTYFQDQATWDEERIKERGAHLFINALQLWPRPAGSVPL